MNLDLGSFEMILLAELRIGLPPLFYHRLATISDDWAFVLKLHSFFEGILTKLLEEKFRAGAPAGESMTPRDSFVSRIHLAERMGLLEPDYRSFLMALNRLRNDITHNIRFIDFDFRRYVDGLLDKDFRRTAASLCTGFKDVPADERLSAMLLPGNARRNREIRTMRELFWHASPKISIWNAGVWTLDLLSLHFHIEPQGDTFRVEPGIEAKLQDLLLDPTVLEFKRKIADGLLKETD